MTVSLRLDEHLEKKLSSAAQAEGVSKSEDIRRCLEEFLNTKTQEADAWEAGKDLFGRHASGRGDLSENCEQILRKRFHGKADRD